MKAHQAEHAVATLCRVLEISRSGDYAWARRKPSAHPQWMVPQRRPFWSTSRAAPCERRWAAMQNPSSSANGEHFEAPRPAERGTADVLTRDQAAELSGVASANTVGNWLESGELPGAFQTPGGHWRFPRAEVEAVKARMDALRQKNLRGDLTSLPDVLDAPEEDR